MHGNQTQEPPDAGHGWLPTRPSLPLPAPVSQWQSTEAAAAAAVAAAGAAADAINFITHSLNNLLT